MHVSETESDLVSEGDRALAPRVWAKAILPTVVFLVVFQVCDEFLVLTSPAISRDTSSSEMGR